MISESSIKWTRLLSFIILVFFHVNGKTYGQGNTELLILSKKNIQFSDGFKAKLSKKFKTLEASKDQCVKSSCLARILHYQASIIYNLDRSEIGLNKIENLLDSAMLVNKEWTCNVILNFEQMDSIDRSNSSELIYFALYFSASWWGKNKFECLQLVQEESSENYVTERPLDSIVTIIGNRDQKFRNSLGDGSISSDREKNDLANRMTVDSLYGIYDMRLFDLVSQNKHMVLWLVLHHSIDCKWNKTWFQILLDAYAIEKYNGGFLDNTFLRFYHPESGYCTNRDSVKAAKFIALLKEKYPSKYGEIFGYSSF